MCQWVQTSVIRSALEESAILAFDPWPGLCILSSLMRRDAKLQSLNAARPPGHLSKVAAVLSAHPGGHQSQNLSLWGMLVIVFAVFCDFIFLFFFALTIHHHLSVCLLVLLSFMVERACLWLSCRPQTIPPIFIPFHHNPLSVAFTCMCLHVTRQQWACVRNLTNRDPPLLQAQRNENPLWHVHTQLDRGLL